MRIQDGRALVHNREKPELRNYIYLVMCEIFLRDNQIRFYSREGGTGWEWRKYAERDEKRNGFDERVDSPTISRGNARYRERDARQNSNSRSGVDHVQRSGARPPPPLSALQLAEIRLKFSRMGRRKCRFLEFPGVCQVAPRRTLVRARALRGRAYTGERGASALCRLSKARSQGAYTHSLT